MASPLHGQALYDSLTPASLSRPFSLGSGIYSLSSPFPCQRSERTGICSYLWISTLFWVLYICSLILLSQLYCKVVINPFYKGESGGLEKLSNLPKVTQMGSDRFRTEDLSCSRCKSLNMLTIPQLFLKLRVPGCPR